jgi:hypothetical protein
MAAVEFALLLPFFILLIVSALVMGHAMFVRTRLMSHAFTLARSCAVELERSEEEVDCEGEATEHFVTTFESNCDPAPELELSTEAEIGGLIYVKAVKLDVRCQYTNGWLALLESRLEEALSFGDFTVSALVPYSVRSPEESLLDAAP